MNIKDAKQQILNAIQAYLITDESGDYRISIEHERPVFLLGAPGIGKTAIMEQIAQETGVNLVTYSMSHHTRESALGLPVIVHRNYTGADVQISEYTALRQRQPRLRQMRICPHFYLMRDHF